MKKNILATSIVCSLFALFTACSSDSVEQNTPTVQIGGKGMNIYIETETYGNGSNKASRSTAEKPVTQTVDLGNGMTAEVSIQEDAPQAEMSTASRAAMSDGRYTMYAIDTSGNRVTGANSTLTGTVSGGVFTKDAGSIMELPAGTYTFVCYNDGVTDDGTNLRVTNGNKDALIGTTTAAITASSGNITFLMKHQTARVRVRITAYTDEISQMGILFFSPVSYNQPDTVKYAFDTTTSAFNTTTVLGGSLFSTGIGGPNTYTLANATPKDKHSTYVQANRFVTDYVYILPDWDMADNLTQLAFQPGSTIYGETSAGGEQWTWIRTLGFGSLGKLKRNGSYTIDVKMNTTLYLFEDGTVGALAEKGTRTPIAIVAREKTNTEEGLAVALNIAGYGAWGSPAQQGNAIMFSNNEDAFSDMQGEHWTWDASGSLDGVTVKAEDATNYPAFYAAAHYNPGVTITGSNIRRWFLPSGGQWRLFLEKHGNMQFPATGSSDWQNMLSNSSAQWDYDKLDLLFTQAGGQAMAYQWQRSSTEKDTGGDACFQWNNFYGNSKQWPFDVRSFVHF